MTALLNERLDGDKTLPNKEKRVFHCHNIYAIHKSRFVHFVHAPSLIILPRLVTPFRMENNVSGLQKITKLESPDQYIEWHRQITDFLSTHNYGRAFSALTEAPVKLQSGTEREYANVLEKWEEKQDNACNCVRATLGFNPERSSNWYLINRLTGCMRS
jgi:hypothetical protein